MKEPRLSVVVLTHRRPALLKTCLESVFAADLSRVEEILIVLNGAEDESVGVAAGFASRHRLARLLAIPRSSRGRARTLAAAASSAEIIHFLDDDLRVSPGLFEGIARRFDENPGLSVVGGPNLTPPESPAFGRAVGRVLSSRLGAWRMRARYSRLGPVREVGEESLMLCSLSFRADADGPGGLRFDERLASAEENLLIERLRRRGGRLLYDPALIVHHRRRETWRGFLAQTFQSGAGRLQAAWLSPSSLRPVHLAPPAFVLFLAFLPALPSWALLLPGAYAAWVASECAFAARQEGVAVAARMAALLPMHHLSYAAGFLLGPFCWVEPEGR